MHTSILLCRHHGWLLSRKPHWMSTRGAASPITQGLSPSICFPSSTAFTDAKEEHVDLVGGNKEALQAALQTLQRMLSAPVWTSAAGEDPRLLEMLQVVFAASQSPQHPF